MEVLEHGIYGIKRKNIAICHNCKCKFKFEDSERQYDMPSYEYWIECPDCEKIVYLGAK